jgi:hypothetical protein
MPQDRMLPMTAHAHFYRRTPSRVAPFCRPNYHHRKVAPMAGAAGGPLTVSQVCDGYGLTLTPPVLAAPPPIGIISLGGGYTPAQITALFAAEGLPAPSITDISVRGATNSPGQDADIENVLDIYMSGGVYAKKTGTAAKIYFASAPNDDNGIADAATALKAAGCVKITCSWGAPFSQWTPAAITYTEAAFSACAAAGITIHVATGDQNADDGTSGPMPDYPACSVYSVAVGGTTLTLNPLLETVWDDAAGEGTGGGFESSFQQPAWQSGLFPAAQGRGEPDVAWNADPNTGYPLGDYGVIGGTSAAAPAWAGLGAAAVACGAPVQFDAPIIYANAKLLRDITQGENAGYSAGPGWDPCTGNGTGTEAFFAAVVGTSAPPTNPPGPGTATVPNVTGMSYPSAKLAVTGAGLVISPPTAQTSQNVTGQSPSAGASVVSGSTVTVTLSPVVTPPPPPPPYGGPTLAQVLAAVDAKFAAIERTAPAFLRPLLKTLNKEIDAAITAAWGTMPAAAQPEFDWGGLLTTLEPVLLQIIEQLLASQGAGAAITPELVGRAMRHTEAGNVAVTSPGKMQPRQP